MLDGEVQEIRNATHELMRQGLFEDAKPLIEQLITQNPNDAAALNFMGYILLENQQYHLAYQFIRRALQEKPDMAPLWVNFGMAAHELKRNDEAMNAYMKAAQLDPDYAKAYSNASALLVERSQWDDAEKACNLALEADPKDDNAQKNLAHVKLAKHQWAEGWKLWELSLGNKFRKEWSYGEESRWDGSKGKCVVVYGEQGLGDEIMYSSVIPDAIADCKKVIIDCDPRLEKLFKRSFPKADVHGTRRDDSPEWLKNARINARCAMASLPSFYRNKDEDFPGTPYLKADPELVRMFSNMWDGKKAIGICTHGGGKHTGEAWRKLVPEDFSPILGNDAVFVSLDYKGELNHPKIKELHWATKCSDYDLTAALIASLDVVVGINTTAMLCADALGVVTHTLVPTKHDWRHEGENLWSKTNNSYVQADGESWRDVIKRIKLQEAL